SQLKHSFEQLTTVNKQLNQYMGQFVEHQKRKSALLMEKLILLNPLEIMKRGFAVPYTDDGQIISSSRQVQQDDFISVQLSDGEIDCQVLNVKETQNGK